jgi:hypothetical protein
LERRDAGGLPAADQQVGSIVDPAGNLSSVAKGKLVDITGDESLIDVEIGQAIVQRGVVVAKVKQGKTLDIDNGMTRSYRPLGDDIQTSYRNDFQPSRQLATSAYGRFLWTETVVLLFPLIATKFDTFSYIVVIEIVPVKTKQS